MIIEIGNRQLDWSDTVIKVVNTADKSIVGFYLGSRAATKHLMVTPATAVQHSHSRKRISPPANGKPGKINSDTFTSPLFPKTKLVARLVPKEEYMIFEHGVLINQKTKAA